MTAPYPNGYETEPSPPGNPDSHAGGSHAMPSTWEFCQSQDSFGFAPCRLTAPHYLYPSLDSRRDRRIINAIGTVGRIEKAHIRLERGSGMSKVGINGKTRNPINYNSTHALDLYGLAILVLY